MLNFNDYIIDKVFKPFVERKVVRTATQPSAESVKATKVARLKPDDAGHGVLRVPNAWIKSDKNLKGRFYRKECVTVYNQKTHKFVVLSVMGGGSGQNGYQLDSGSVAMDYDSFISLGLKNESEGSLLIRSATKNEEVYSGLYQDPDPRMRLSHRIAQKQDLLAIEVSVFCLLIGLMA